MGFNSGFKGLMSGNYYEEEFSFLRKERSWTTVKKTVDVILCTYVKFYTQWFIKLIFKFYMAVALRQDCIVQSNCCIVLYYYIDQFHVQFDSVQMTDGWNVNCVTVAVRNCF